MISKRYVYLFLLFIGFVYFSFKINVHTWETYYYTGCLDRFIHAQDMKPPTMTLELPYEKLICLHYTQHPVLYYLTYIICKTLFSLKDGLFIVQLLNILTGIVACFICYHVCLLYTRSQRLSICMMMIIAFSDVYWYQCLSGEVYIQPFLFLVLSYYFLLKADISSDNTHFHYKQILFSSIAAGCAVSFHMFSSLFYFVILYYLIEMKRLDHNFSFHLMTGISALIMLFFFCVTYVIPYFIVFQLNSISEWFHLVFLHTHNWGIWHVPLKYVLFEIIWSFFVGIKHLFHSFVSGFTPISIIFRTFLLIIFSCAMWHFFFRDKERKLEKKVLLLWFFIYFIFITINVPMVNDYWCFIIFPMLMFVVMVFKQMIRTNRLFYIFAFTICLLMPINLINDIYPKHRIKKDDYFMLAKAEKTIKKTKHIVSIGSKHILSEIWYLNQQSKNKKLYYHAPDLQYQSKKDFLASFKSLIQPINTNNFVLIIDGSAMDYVRVKSLIKQMDMKSKLIFRISQEYQNKVLKTAIGLNEKPIIMTVYGMLIQK